MIPLVQSGQKAFAFMDSHLGSFVKPGAVSPDFENDMTSSDGWTLDTNWAITGSELVGTTVDLTTTERGSHAMGFTASDITWYARCKVFVTSIATNRGICGISLTDSAGVINDGDAVCLYFKDTFGSLLVGERSYLAGVHDGETIDIALSYSTTYYIDMARTSATNVRIRVFSDDTFTTQVGEDNNGSLNSGNGSLSVVQMGSVQAGNAGEKGTIKSTDWQVWDNVTEKP